ncbi:MAG TPA: SPASM domain-containing protein [Thermodesulfovibrionales bacterium]|nr:SPASM domain-containing protein [Thermodesulfovibrionales bacterium]
MNSVNIIHIETLNLCTRHCWYCKFGQNRQDPSTLRMTDELIETIADTLHDIDYSGRISPFGINEPLLDPRMPEMISLLRSKCPRAFISLVSNGDLLTRELYETLVASGMDALGLSCHDESSWQRLKPYARYPNVRLIDMRRPKEILSNRGGEVKLRNSIPQTNKPCFVPLKTLEIRSNGDVVLCCNDMYSDVVMGNIAFQPLEEIRNSKQFLNYRSKLASADRRGLKLCEVCNRTGGNCNWKFPLEDFDWIPKPLRKAVYRWTPATVKKLVKKVGNL